MQGQVAGRTLLLQMNLGMLIGSQVRVGFAVIVHFIFFMLRGQVSNVLCGAGCATAMATCLISYLADWVIQQLNIGKNMAIACGR